MNLKISVFFRAIPLLMGAICLAFGLYVREMGVGDGYIIAGNVLISLTAICIALFATAATIIRQIIKRYTKADKVFYPILGYAAGIITFICGIMLFTSGGSSADFVSGNVVSGVGLIACCVATVAISSGKFSKITENSSVLTYGQPVKDGYSKQTYAIYFSIPIICTMIALIRGIILLAGGSTPSLVAGHVMIGLGLICACLIALVATILRQIQNKFGNAERWKWSIFVAVLGTTCLIWGILLMIPYSAAMVAPGFVLIGLGLICYSISSKVLLLASVWRRSAPLGKRIPMIPVMTALSCLFLAAFLFEASYTNPSFFVPAHIIVGLGAVCFTLFAIVSILESGTAKSS
ncbi:MAG: DUF2776 family protein [Christensenella sp.]|uniref:DUF2776 family protein n=1 Tax=Christensenella sp. TaxID=1935934 RepID=UPI002B214CE2|nr:DUF2776 family protein [Christensenella sp.]MEA5003485.1 DUF2776 family protein [Christensenella sp.]